MSEPGGFREAPGIVDRGLRMAMRILLRRGSTAYIRSGTGAPTPKGEELVHQYWRVPHVRVLVSRWL